ncbi:MAG: single-stranded-DNA-specific exonuclease RecJ [Cytophagaceae bacterium]
MKRWVIKPEPEPEIVSELQSALNISKPLAELLLQREINSFEKAKLFFRPSIDQLHDPFKMKDMHKAVRRLNVAIENNEKILVYGDYDVDGTTAVSLFYGFLKNYYPNLDFYIPDRYSEGYGVSAKGIDFAFDNNFKLIISLDCGIKSAREITYARNKGIDFIVCDHHNPGTELPAAYAILDPKRKDCEYPFKELSGCGVGFKFLQAFCIDRGIDSSNLFKYLDLLAVSIASDIVPVIGENRILLYYGIKILNECPRPGMKALIDVAGIKKVINVESIVFGLGPRINAAGRIAHAKAAVELMLAENAEDSIGFARRINEKNIIRKDFDSSITQEAIRMIQDDNSLLSARSTVLYKEDWHKGVIGIVASRCIEKYHRPTIILTHNKGYATGSARSVPGFDVYEAISQCADLLEQFGGHTYAAGLTIKLDKIHEFRNRFEEVVSKSIKEEMLIPKIDIDLKLPLNKINQKFYNVLKQLAPFGPGNMEPVFLSENVCDDGSARLLKGEHLKLRITQEDGNEFIDAIGFNMPEFYPKISKGHPFNLCYQITENEFNGRKSLQLMIKDIKFVNQENGLAV